MSDPEVRISRNDDARRYELHIGDELAGFAEFRIRAGRIVFIHTVVLPGHEGEGLGSRLARHVLDDAVSRGERIVPLCPFIAAYLRRHDGYEAWVDWPEEAVQAE